MQNKKTEENFNVSNMKNKGGGTTPSQKKVIVLGVGTGLVGACILGYWLLHKNEPIQQKMKNIEHFIAGHDNKNSAPAPVKEMKETPKPPPAPAPAPVAKKEPPPLPTAPVMMEEEKPEPMVSAHKPKVPAIPILSKQKIDPNKQHRFEIPVSQRKAKEMIKQDNHGGLITKVKEKVKSKLPKKQSKVADELEDDLAFSMKEKEFFRKKSKKMAPMAADRVVTETSVNYSAMSSGPLISTKPNAGVIVSRDPYFNSTYLQGKTNKLGEFRISSPPPGAIYWKLEGTNKVNKININSPESTNVKFSVPAEMTVGRMLSWSGNSNVSYFKIEVASDLNFSSQLHIYTTKSTEMNTKIIGPGNWFIRIGAMNLKSGSFEFTPATPLTILDPSSTKSASDNKEKSKDGKKDVKKKSEDRFPNLESDGDFFPNYESNTSRYPNSEADLDDGENNFSSDSANFSHSKS
jgi:hypothetical protein